MNEAPDANAYEFHSSGILNMQKKLMKKYHADCQDGKRRRQRRTCLVYEGPGFETSAWNVQAGISQTQGNYLFIGTRLRHIDSVLRCKQQVCHHELHLRRGLTLLELERRTLSESLTESAAWLGSHFSGIGAYASVRSQNAGEELVFAFYLDNQVDGKLTISGINGVAC